VFVTSQGSAYSQFKRALDRRNFLLAWTLAADLPKVPLADALSLLLLALEQQPWRFDLAAPRWHGRLCAEARLTLAEAQLALAALDALGGPGAAAGGRALVAVFGRHGLDDAIGVLTSWLSAGDGPTPSGVESRPSAS
jgi:hypothetical protein